MVVGVRDRVQSGAVPLAASPNPLVANSRAPRHSRANVDGQDGIQFQCSRELWMRWGARRDSQFRPAPADYRPCWNLGVDSGHNAVVGSSPVGCGVGGVRAVQCFNGQTRSGWGGVRQLNSRTQQTGWGAIPSAVKAALVFFCPWLVRCRADDDLVLRGTDR